MVIKYENTTLSARGYALTQQLNMREMASMVLDKYDPHTNPDGWALLGVAENYAMLPEIASYIEQRPCIKLSANDFSYNEGPWGLKRLRQALARLINQKFNPVKEVKESELCVSNGMSPLCSMLGFVCCEEGDGILIGQPCYGAFVEDFGRAAKAKMVMVPFGEVDPFSVDGVQCYETALEKAQGAGTRIKALLLCNPNNPTGRCYPHKTIVEIMRLCQHHRIHLFCDEIYGMSVYETDSNFSVPFESVISFDSSKYLSPDYLHMMYAMSKDLGAGGLRVGCLVSGNQELRMAVDQLTLFHWPGIADQRIAIEMLEDEEWLESFFSVSREKLLHHAKFTRSMLDEKGISYSSGASAGFFFLIDLRRFLKNAGKDGWEAENGLVQAMMKSKLFLTDGKMMWSEEPGWFRIVFSQDMKTLEEGLRRLFEVLHVQTALVS
jgi:1-aminocyclopropane-1-carboxylate synthase